MHASLSLGSLVVKKFIVMISSTLFAFIWSIMCLIITIYNGTHKNMLLIIQTVFFLFVVSQPKWLAHFLQLLAMENFTEINTFRLLRTTLSSIFLIRLRFQGYRCKSDIAIFGLRVKLITVPKNINIVIIGIIWL